MVDLLVKCYSWLYEIYMNSERKIFYLLGFAWQSNERLLFKATKRYLPIYAWFAYCTVSNDCFGVAFNKTKTFLGRYRVKCSHFSLQWWEKVVNNCVKYVLLC